jgi:hypothetical protein
MVEVSGQLVEKGLEIRVLFFLTLHYPESVAFPLLSFTFVCSPRLLKQEVKRDKAITR